jgi:hypothetical protein
MVQMLSPVWMLRVTGRPARVFRTFASTTALPEGRFMATVLPGRAE